MALGIAGSMICQVRTVINRFKKEATTMVLSLLLKATSHSWLVVLNLKSPFRLVFIEPKDTYA